MSEVDVRYRYRLRTSASERQALQAVFDSCRFCWNQALRRWSDLWHHERARLSYLDAARELTDWRGRYEWLSIQPQCPQQQVLRALYRAILAFFDKTIPASRPRPKCKRDGYATAEWTRNGFAVSGTGLGSEQTDRLEVAVAGGRIPLRVVWSRPLPSSPTSVTVYRDRAGRWWASFVCRIQVPDEPIAPTGRATGLDVGLARFGTTEDPATDVHNPRFARSTEKAKTKADSRLARKRPGSKNRDKARQRKACLEAKVAARRTDFAHKTARDLLSVSDRIGVEDLRVKNMSRSKGRSKTGLNRAIGDAGWAQFRRILAWQATKVGKTVVISKVSDSTQRCSTCGVKAKPRIELSDRVFRCRCCGLVLDRDRNAARNLNPDRLGLGGRTEPSGRVPEGDDGNKTLAPGGAEAA